MATSIAILGCGVVGSGVHEVLTANAASISEKVGDEILVKKILDIRDFTGHEYEHLFTKDFEEILNDSEIKVVAEVIGGVEPAYTFTKKALMNGKSVVTSNKELVAKKGAELLQIASENNVHYMFEASVGGGIPIIRPMSRCLAANNISEIMGILNGTTNYILTEMFKKGKSFEAALKDAQDKGYAERNPAADVEGIDACRKISILSDIVSGHEVNSDNVYTEGITNISSEDIKYVESIDCVLKLVAVGRMCDERVFARVSPLIIPGNHPLSVIEGVFNGVVITGDATGDVMFYGKGAGKLPTASAVVADIIDIVRTPDVPSIKWTATSDKNFMVDISETSSKFFVRAKNLTADAAANIFGQCNVLDLSINRELAFVTREINEAEFIDRKNDAVANGAEFVSVIRKID